MQALLRRHRSLRWQQMLADAERAAVLEALELDLRMLGARGVDDERAQPIAALDRPLRDVDVLHARARHVDHHAPVDALADFNALIVDAIRGVSIGARGPANREHQTEQRQHEPRNQLQERRPAGFSPSGDGAEGEDSEPAEGQDAGEDAAADLLQRNNTRVERLLLTVRHDGNCNGAVPGVPKVPAVPGVLQSSKVPGSPIYPSPPRSALARVARAGVS